MVLNQAIRSSIVNEVAASITPSPDPFSGLVDIQDLLGFRIGWFPLEAVRRIVEPRGLPPEDCELVLMRARGRTDVHAHLRGHSTFLVLGLKHGFPEPDGGVELGLQPVGVLEATPMHEEPHVAGEVFDVESCEIHAFYADPGKELFVVGFVHPRIRQGDGFDVVDYVRDAADPSMVRMVSGCW